MAGKAKKLIHKIHKYFHPSKAKLRFFFSEVVLPAFFAAILIYSGYEYDIERDSFKNTCDYLDSLENMEQRVIWTNKKELCGNFKGQCFWGSEIPDDTDLDYIVFISNRIGVKDINNGRFDRLLRYLKDNGPKKGGLVLKAFTRSIVVNVKYVPPELLPTLPRFTFAILGDTQSWPTDNDPTIKFESILEQIKKFQPDFILSMGDLSSMNSCQEPEKCRIYFENWRDKVKLISPAIYPAVGNHDYENGAMDLWQDVFHTPGNGPVELSGTAYSFDHKNSHFVFLNSEQEDQQAEGSKQMLWLEDDLANNSKRNTFVISHRPNFPSSSSLNQAHQWQVLLDHKVVALFSGHEHYFCYRPIISEEIDGLENGTMHYFIIGNSGSKPKFMPTGCQQSSDLHHFAIVSVKGQNIEVKAYNFKGKEISAVNMVSENYYK